MSAALHLARPDDLERLLPLVAAMHAEAQIDQDEARRRDALTPLLEGSPHGAVYLIGPRGAPIGYVIVTFGWSVEFGGLDGFIDELYVRRAVRGRGIAGDALDALARALREAGVVALHLEVDRENAAARRLYARARFAPRERYMLMSRKL
ncbi:GNAT family N-acetyltransferase [Rhodosalinus halophilus]|uniref:GNAT family N-acetyltransferase n=1 Tax=Rhodosalinus halophilus TaxID=2259333 RepID=A0A365U504_9RHOB|nr:GNAT family N-acetyltransferase [Rhodosalinus halophilus]RBI82925.1 GNAT family N-acetyltransferase [Rhodosalinus halophilus]